jgi:hypothetical protein
MKGWLCYTSGKMAVSHSCLYHERGTDLGGNVPCSLPLTYRYRITSCFLVTFCSWVNHCGGDFIGVGET